MSYEYYFCPMSPDSNVNIETFLNGHGMISTIFDYRLLKSEMGNIKKSFEKATIEVNEKIYDIKLADVNESDMADYLNLIIYSDIEINEFKEDIFNCKIKIPINETFECNIDSIINKKKNKYYIEIIDDNYYMIIQLTNKEYIRPTDD